MMPEIKVDPKVKIRIVPDGEIHIVFSFSLDDLAEFARAFLAMSDGKIKEGDAGASFRLRNKDGIDYMIQELQKARNELFGYK